MSLLLLRGRYRPQVPFIVSCASHPRPPTRIRPPNSRTIRTGGRGPTATTFGRPVGRRPQLQHHRWTHSGAFLTVFPWSDFSNYYLRYLLFPRSSLSIPDNDDSSESSSYFRLATSTAALDEQPKNDSLWHRIARWIRHFFQHCRDVVLVTVRGSEIVLRLSPLLVLTPASIVATRYLGLPQVADGTWIYLRSTITALGPAFVKLAQWMATRRDLFPPALCDRLAVLQDQGVPHHWKYTDAALREAFGDDYRERGLQVEHCGDSASSLLGCGSAAQVYKGTLKTTTKTKKKHNQEEGEVVHYRPVAIKVLHPNLQVRIERDLWFVQTVANLVHSLPSETIQMLNLPRAVANFGSILHRQADLIFEADNLARFRHNFYLYKDEDQESKILFPRPLEGWVSTQVLVEDLVVNATPIADFLKDSTEEGIRIRRELASPLLRAFLKMVFIDNFIHCDLHSGNVMVQTTTVERPHFNWKKWWFPFSTTLTTSSEGINSEPSSSSTTTTTETRRQIVFLDAGIATSLSPNDQRNLVDLFRAVILNEGDRAGRLMVERARYERCSQTPGGVDAFAHGIAELVSEFHDRRQAGLTLGAVRIGSLLSRVLDLCRVHGVEIDPAMASIVISTLVLEGLGRSLEPNLNLIDFALPFVLGRGRV